MIRSMLIVLTKRKMFSSRMTKWKSSNITFLIRKMTKKSIRKVYQLKKEIRRFHERSTFLQSKRKEKNLFVQRQNTRIISRSEKSKMNSKSDSFFEIDVVYIPHHGDENYVDEEFFRRIHARFYILNAVDIRQQTLEALINGKSKWETNEQVLLEEKNSRQNLVRLAKL